MVQCAIAIALGILAVAAPAPPAAVAADSSYVIRLDLGADVRALGSDDPFVSDPAAARLAGLGAIALPVLSAALRREPPATRVHVVEILQEIDGAAATRLLIEAAGDPDAAVRADALLALGMRKASAGGAVVEAHLADPAPQARRSAALACHALCTSPAALDRLVQLAIRDRATAAAAQQSLQTIVLGDDAGRAAAARAAIERQALPLVAAPDADEATRANAALVVAMAGRPEAVPALGRALAGAGGPAPQTAALALGGIAEPSAVAALAPAVGGNDPTLRHAACVSLRRLAERQVAGAADAAAACPTPRQ